MTRGGVGNRPSGRRCAVSGERGERGGLLRFAAAPDGIVVADLGERLPGRGVWVGARRSLVREAVRRNVFARGLRRADVRPPEDLDRQVERALVERLCGRLGLARRAGRLVAGYEATRERLRGRPVGMLVEASDGGDRCRKLRAMQPEAPVLACLDAAEIGAALGRERLAHGALEPGGWVAGLTRDSARLDGFRSPEEQGRN